MVVGGHPGVGVGLLPDGVRLHNVGDGERPAQHVGAPQPPLQGEQRLAPEEQARIQGRGIRSQFLLGYFVKYIKYKYISRLPLMTFSWELHPIFKKLAACKVYIK